MMNNIRMSCFPSVRNLHDCATIVSIGSVLNMLNPTIRESNLVLAHNISILITRPVLTEVCVILVIMHSIFKCKWVRLFMIISTMDWANMNSIMANSNSTTMSSYMPTTMSTYNTYTMSSAMTSTVSSKFNTSWTSHGGS